MAQRPPGPGRLNLLATDLGYTLDGVTDTSPTRPTASDEAGLASLDELVALTPVQRFDQLVRTVRFIDAGRRAVRRSNRG